MRNYCAKCNRRRDEKFMRQSPISKHSYCYRPVKRNLHDESCYDEHIKEEIYIKKLELLSLLNVVPGRHKNVELKMSLQEDITTAVEMSKPEDINQTDLLDEISNVEKTQNADL